MLEVLVPEGYFQGHCVESIDGRQMSSLLEHRSPLSDREWGRNPPRAGQMSVFTNSKED